VGEQLVQGEQDERRAEGEEQAIGSLAPEAEKEGRRHQVAELARDTFFGCRWPPTAGQCDTTVK
jgi:hypothetical protein